jgi:hypothetical protein
VRGIRFYNKPGGASYQASTSIQSPKILHIETDGCIVNIQVGLSDRAGRPVTNVSVTADGHNRGGDGQGRIWQAEVGPDADGEGVGIRVVMTEGRDAHDEEATR